MRYTVNSHKRTTSLSTHSENDIDSDDADDFDNFIDNDYEDLKS